jgi:deoxyribodipyrimidine photo-lyase
LALTKWCLAWAKLLEKEPHLLELSDPPHGNDVGIRQHEHFGKLFDATSIPDQVEGFECEDREEMAEVWPEGTEVAKEVS